jgi:hypothetical protein
LKNLGLSGVEWLPLACSPEIHARYDMPYEHDLCFIGHLYPGARQEVLDAVVKRFPNVLVVQRFFEEMAREEKGTGVNMPN